MLAWFTWQQCLEESLSDTPWIISILAIAGLIILALAAPSRPSRKKRPVLPRSAADNHKPVRSSVDMMYSSARNIADKFFKTTEKRAKRQASNVAHLIRVFAYLGPKFLLNVKVKGFEETHAARELVDIALGGFRALAEFEESMFRAELPADALKMMALKPVSEIGDQDAAGIISRLDAIFAECSDNIIREREFPLDPLFSELDRYAHFAVADPSARHRVYHPLIQEFYEIWSDRDLSGLNLSKIQNAERNVNSPLSEDLAVALDKLLDSLTTRRPKRPDTKLPAAVSLKRDILRAALTRDEKTGVAALYDKQLSKEALDLQSTEIRRRVAQLKAELGKAHAARIERLFDKLCGNRPDLAELEQSVRSENPEYESLPRLR
jgi:hypothetical protein